MTTHEMKMAAKRKRNRTMTTGFTPMPNTRLALAIQAEQLRCALAGITDTAEPLRRVAARLPARRMDAFRHAKPSKSDDRAYRIGNR